jgi:hypothetical protein
VITTRSAGTAARNHTPPPRSLALTTLPETDADTDAEPETLPLTLDDAATLLLALTLAVTDTLASTDALTLDVAVTLAVTEPLPDVDAVAAAVCGSGAYQGERAEKKITHERTGQRSCATDLGRTEREVLHCSLWASEHSNSTTFSHYLLPHSPGTR